MRSKKRRILLVMLAAVIAAGFQIFGNHLGITDIAYASTAYVKSKLINKPSTVQGDENVIVVIEIENMSNTSFTFNSAELKVDKPNNVAVSGGITGSTTLTKGGKTTVSFYLDIGKHAATGSRYLNLILRNDGVAVHENLSLGSFSIREKLAAPGNSSNHVAAFDMVHYINPESGFDSGQDNTLTIEIRNNGNTIVKNAELSLILPDGLSIYNASNSANLGYISVGSSREVSFPITVDNEAKAKTYEVTARLTGLSYSNEEVSIEKTFYVPVKGSGTSIKNAEITNISVPSEVIGQDEFILSFEVYNNNSADLKNVNINVDIPDGLLNKTRSTFIEPVIPANSRKAYSVTLFAEDGAKERSYPIKISLSSGSSAGVDDVVQYANVYVSGTSGSKTPQLMVDSYNYGGTFVQAGKRFVLCLSLYNTSGSHTLSNIKVTISSEDGTFIPVNSSNSFYIETLGKKEHIDQYLHLSVKPTAEQKTTALNVNMTYEDSSGNTFTAEDIISIPVLQDTRLEVGDIIAPPELYAMMQSWVSMEFYNTGKTTLYNLRVSAEGDFDTTESTSYFVGNMESGSSDSYDFSFIPRSAGTMDGKVVFTFEDASGEEQTIERPFSFQVMEEMPVFDPGGMMPEELEGGDKSNKLPWILEGIFILICGGGIFVWKKLRRKKMQQEMEINE
ncbi:MAG: COG1361 S-layer family protein [Anaerovoracaceae bacterium]